MWFSFSNQNLKKVIVTKQSENNKAFVFSFWVSNTDEDFKAKI